MLTGKIIANAKDLFSHCQDTRSHGLKLNEKDNTATVRELIYIDVDRTSIQEVATLIGSRKVHSIRNTGTPLSVESRNLSCFCKSCQSPEVDPCENIEYVDSWKTSNLKRIQFLIYLYVFSFDTIFMKNGKKIFR